ncbi:hypothetical protein BIW11_08860 [Tropilaelaps mercedesae]|uniref:protein-tyrosine-phosphatase n=1 Tax=Tropilaelaps mercedesae TaxID=418985 RepID=A0A1V9XMM4_9ACAR|nr:hypothetical protein BIW11_08860 [Tropilaelaps mercedesae]
MMTCDSCPTCPVPLKRSRNHQVDLHHHQSYHSHHRITGGPGTDDDVPASVVPCGGSAPAECPGCRISLRLRKFPSLHPPALSLSLGRRHKRQQHSPSAARHIDLIVSAQQGAATFVMTSSACDGLGAAGRGALVPDADKNASVTRGIVDTIDCHELAILLEKKEDLLVIDSRSFMDFNTYHIRRAVNVANSKIGKRRLQQERVSVRDLLINNCDADSYTWAVVYDTNSRNVGQLPADSFQAILLEKLAAIFPRASLLNGGFCEFQSSHPNLVEDKQRSCAPLASTLSQPCMTTTNAGLTRILPFLYLGSQQDAHNRQLLWDHNITYVLNVSATCPKAEFIPEPQFLRISVNDNYSEKLLPHFAKASHFVECARESGGCVLVHCLAGVSRSPTMAIAYVMKHLRMSSDDAYRYVKSKRPTISPNFNFLGQLLEYEEQLRREKVLEKSDICSSAPILSPTRPLSPGSGLMSSSTCDRDLRDFVTQKKQRLSPRTTMQPRQLTLALKRPMETVQASPPEGNSPASGAVSPTTGIANLNFGGSQEKLSASQPTRPLEVVRSLSCNLEWLGAHEDENLPPSEIEHNTSLSPATERPAQLPPGYHLQSLQQSPPVVPSSEIAACKRKELSKGLCKTLSGASLRRHLRRSDSVSTCGTSGYGSQISDHLDTLEDDVLSDPDESVILRTPNVQSEHGHNRVSRHDSAYRSMTFEENFALGFRDSRDKEQRHKPLGSPLSPSEQHLVADFEIDTLLEGEPMPLKTPELGCYHVDTQVPSLWESRNAGPQAELESLHDSGYITSVSSVSSNLTSSMRSSIISSSTSSACSRRGARSGTTDSWRTQCSATRAELESSHDSGIITSLTSSTSSMRSSVMSPSGYSTCNRLREVLCSTTAASTSELEVRASCVRLSQQAKRTIAHLTQLASRTHSNNEHAKQMVLPRARSLPGLEALRAGEPNPTSACLHGQQPRNRHSYSGAVELNCESPGSPAPTARIAVSIAVS